MEKSSCAAVNCAGGFLRKKNKILKEKAGEAVVELDNFKYTLSTYDKPLVEVRDSL